MVRERIKREKEADKREGLHGEGLWACSILSFGAAAVIFDIDREIYPVLLLTSVDINPLEISVSVSHYQACPFNGLATYLPYV